MFYKRHRKRRLGQRVSDVALPQLRTILEIPCMLAVSSSASSQTTPGHTKAASRFPGGRTFAFERQAAMAGKPTS